MYILAKWRRGTLSEGGENVARAPERPIFVDPTGRRRWISLCLILTAIIVSLTSIGVFGPQALESQAYTAGTASAEPARTSSLSTEVIAHTINIHNVPILGTGPLVRVAKLDVTKDGMVATDPYNTAIRSKLNQEDAALTSGYQYAIIRYGQTATKRIALTFDDGPDPVYTPQILDKLSKAGAQATFFVVGSNVIKHPELAQRIIHEGHTIGNHSFTHPNFLYKGQFRTFQEINQTDHVIRSVTHRTTPFFRPPYVGMDDQELRNNIRAVLDGQKQGYTIALYTFDTKDWALKKGQLPPLPTFDGSDTVVLLHDSGGNRSATVKYIDMLAKDVKKHGYSFASLDQLYEPVGNVSKPVRSSSGDTASRLFFSAIYVFPHRATRYLFVLTVALISATLVINLILASLQNRRMRNYKRRSKNYKPSTAVLIPAYNEQKVLKKAVKSVLQSKYAVTEIIIIDDGSTDNTFCIAQDLAATYPQVKAFKKVNGGKTSALNFGLRKTKCEIVICMDADTMFLPSTITRLVRHFKDPSVGCVAGSAKVGNIKNMLTRWQALEYIVFVYIDRSAQAFTNAVMIAPGACSAWRAKAIRAAGNYSSNTFAEDCDLTLALQKTQRYKVLLDSTAYGYTEAPLQLGALAKQRFRWIFGNLQAIWKHRKMMLNRRYGWLGLYFMPIVALNIILPMLLIPLLVFLAITNILSGNYIMLVLFTGIILLTQFIAALAAVLFAHERLRLLFVFPFTRFIYSPLKTYLLYRSAAVIMRGASILWNKLQRTGTVSREYMRA